MRSEIELEKAIDEYADMIKKICFLHLKQEYDIEDIFQNVFLKYAKSSPFQTKEYEKAWLIRVTINECKDSLKTWFKKNVILQDNFDIYQLIPHDDLIRIDILHAIQRLPQKYKNVIYLYYYEEYKIKDIAIILKHNKNTVHTWLRRAKEQLKNDLGGDFLE